jgi:threonine dehydrogenase-like Zn-dependent dehydrogenase
VRVPRADATLEPLPDTVSDTQAAFLSDVLPGTFAGLEMSGLKAGDVVVVVGCGPTGLCAQLCARHMGAAAVFAIDHHAYRLEAARKLGSIPVDLEGEDARSKVRERTEGRGADVAVEATGTPEGLADAVALARPWGTVVNLGVFFDASAEFPIGRLVMAHITLKPAGIPPVKRYIPRLLKLIAQGRLDPSPIASHVFPLAEAPRGYELMANRQDGALKVLLTP